MNGELDFEESLRERVATLAGLPESVFDDRVAPRIRSRAGVPELIAGVHAAGGLVGVVSGGFHEVLDPIAARARPRLLARQPPRGRRRHAHRRARRPDHRRGGEGGRAARVGGGCRHPAAPDHRRRRRRQRPADDGDRRALASASTRRRRCATRPTCILDDARPVGMLLPARLRADAPLTAGQCPMPRPPSTGMTAPEM